MHDLAEGLIGILRRGEALPLARGQEQRLAVGREGDDRTELPARTVRARAPNHALVAQASAIEARTHQREARPAVGARLGVTQVDRAAGREIGRGRDVEQPALPAARRDKVIERAEDQARHRNPA